MLVFISSIDFDLNGSATIDAYPSSDLGIFGRRFNKIKTLDGGVVVNDGGFANGDMEFNFIFSKTSQIDSSLKYIVSTYSQVRVSTRDGVFIAVPTYTPDTPDAQLSLSITEKLSP